MKTFGITIILSIFLFIIENSGGTIFNRFSLIDYPKTDVKKECPPKNFDTPSPEIDSSVRWQTQKLYQPRSSGNVQVTRLIDTLDSMSDDIHKLQDVQNYAHLLPKSISWGQLNSILSQFDHDFYKLSVVQTLRNRIKGDSSKSEFKTFLNLFDDDNDFYKTNARNLLKK